MRRHSSLASRGSRSTIIRFCTTSLARGQDIRDFIAASVDAVGGPVVIVAHSLGAVASVDLLVQREMRQVKALVTVGSQAPFMYEIGALPSLPFDTPLPAHFPKWTNFYDRRDLLSFASARRAERQS